MVNDAVLPFVFESLPVRGAIIQLADAWRRLVGDHDYEAPVLEVLGHAAAATPLIAQSLKAGSKVTLQITGDGPLSMLVMQCTSDLYFRGLASSAGSTAGMEYADLVADARCAITVDNDKTERPYQGIIAVGEDSLAASLENYYLRSAQIPSHITLVANERFAGGILLQQMPGAEGDLGDDWVRLGLLAATLQARDLESGIDTGLVGRLFAEDDVRVFRHRDAAFRCQCSRDRAANVLKLLGEDECESAIADDEQIVVTCEYCGRRQTFDPVDIAGLFADSTAHHSDALH